MSDIDELRQKVIRQEQVLELLICWLLRELGKESCDKLLNILHGNSTVTPTD